MKVVTNMFRNFLIKYDGLLNLSLAVLDCLLYVCLVSGKNVVSWSFAVYVHQKQFYLLCFSLRSSCNSVDFFIVSSGRIAFYFLLLSLMLSCLSASLMQPPTSRIKKASPLSPSVITLPLLDWRSCSALYCFLFFYCQVRIF